jgi:hypothetical protein
MISPPFYPVVSRVASQAAEMPPLQLIACSVLLDACGLDRKTINEDHHLDLRNAV